MENLIESGPPTADQGANSDGAVTVPPSVEPSAQTGATAMGTSTTEAVVPPEGTGMIVGGESDVRKEGEVAGSSMGDQPVVLGGGNGGSGGPGDKEVAADGGGGNGSGSGGGNMPMGNDVSEKKAAGGDGGGLGSGDVPPEEVRGTGEIVGDVGSSGGGLEGGKSGGNGSGGSGGSGEKAAEKGTEEPVVERVVEVTPSVRRPEMRHSSSRRRRRRSGEPTGKGVATKELVVAQGPVGITELDYAVHARPEDVLERA